MPYYCTVPRCTSMAGKAKNVSFHQFPRDEELAKLWNEILKRGKPYTKYSKVCSLHFTPEDYTITSVGKNKGQWRTLRKDAVPSQNLPDDFPTRYQRKQWESWSNNTQSNVLDPTIHQQQVAQAVYMQTMLAMQAGATELPSLALSNDLPQIPTPTGVFPHASNTTDTDVLKGKQTNANENSTSYKCTECSKCFKDPDVFILHKRSHINNERNEKENFNLNLTLQANPILANLLKRNTEKSNFFDGNVFTMEHLLMTAFAANMEGFMRNFTSMMKNDDINSLRHDRGNSDQETDELDSDRGQMSHDIGSYEQSVDLNNRGFFPRGLNSDGIDNGKGKLSGRGHSSHDSETKSDIDSVTDINNSDRDLIRDRIIEMYRNVGSYNNENDSEKNITNTTDNVRNILNKDSLNNDRRLLKDDRSSLNSDGDYGSQSKVEAICDRDLNESKDSNKLVIDEAV